MAWNRADTSSQSAARKPASKSPSAVKGAIAGVVVVALAVAAYFLLFSSGPEKPKDVENKKSSAIPVVTNACAATNAADGVADKSEGWKPPKGAYQDERGRWRHPGGAMVYDPTKCKPSVSLRDPDEKVLPFRRRSEKEIARLLTHEPGRALFGTKRYDAKFEQDFMDSLKEPIIISDDDSDEDKRLKQMVKEAKIEITDRLRDGEKLKDILEGTRKELVRLAEYKRNLNKEIIQQMQNSDLSDKDVDDFVAAANKMLTEQGVEPIKNIGLIKRNLKLTNKRKTK